MLVYSLKFCFVYFRTSAMHINIRIKIVLLIAKFESPIVLRGKMQVEFGIKTPDIGCTIDAFENFAQ